MSVPSVSAGERVPDRVVTPTLLQMEAVECGAAALGVIFRYHHLWIPLEQLRLECAVGRDGSKASNLLKAARRYGMEGQGIRCELDALLKLKPPAILYWNFNHFLVYEGVTEGKVYLNDPATGPRRVALEELEASFTGVVLTIRPGPSFAPGGEKPSLAAALRRRVSGFEIGLSFAFLTGLLLIIPNIVNPSFNRVFIDEYLIGDKTDI
ncbi:MAG TPA: cysteine peptidase family C39 domain-containing protein, partial [Chthoniobacterales bacterium]|nr:cysteine peptidase family C39 domain-containing protein [Chthoniobacterales bacterium]